VTSPLVVPIAEALLDSVCDCGRAQGDLAFLGCSLCDARTAADAVIAAVAALPADYTAVDVLAFLRGDEA